MVFRGIRCGVWKVHTHTVFKKHAIGDRPVTIDFSCSICDSLSYFNTFDSTLYSALALPPTYYTQNTLHSQHFVISASAHPFRTLRLAQRVRIVFQYPSGCAGLTRTSENGARARTECINFARKDDTGKMGGAAHSSQANGARAHHYRGAKVRTLHCARQCARTASYLYTHTIADRGASSSHIIYDRTRSACTHKTASHY